MRVLAAVVSGTALVVTGLVLTAPVAQAGSCYYTNNPQWNTTQWSGTTAGVPTELTLVWYDRYQCLQSVYISFQDSSGATFHSGNAQISHSGETAYARITWTPRAGKNYFYATQTILNQTNDQGSPCYYEYTGCTYTSDYRYSRYEIRDSFQPLAAPSAPYNVTADANNRSIRVRWSPPASNSSAVSEYVVTRLENGEVLCRTTALYCDANDLPDGAYTYQVASKNQIGVGGTSTPTIGVLVAPPNPPAFAGYSLDDSGRNIVFNWDSNTGTSAAPAVYRIYDTGGSEVCGVPVVPGQSMYSCTVTPPKAGSTYSLKVETGMGDSTSVPTALIKPSPDAFFKTCSKVKGQSRDCAMGKTWTFEWCTKKGGKATLATSKGKTVKSGKAKKSSTCVKKKPYLTKFVITEKKTGAKQYVVTLPDKSKKTVAVSSRATLG